MFKRLIEKTLLKTVRTFPVTILTGARQTGKSTICKTLFRHSHKYVSLEDPDIRKQALDDPRTFLKNYSPPVIFDEIQYAPELPSYIQTIVDDNRKKYGQYILTGSQNFLMMELVSQSLAGRAAVLTLYPCSVNEIDRKKNVVRSEPEAVADWILKGGYPEPRARKDLDRKTWCASYIRLYLERDVRQIINVTDLTVFERFLRLVAIRTGQILNISDLARDAAISVPTATRWLSVLQSSYQIYLLEPFHANLSKRLIKAPKIYFCDTALASYLMGIHDSGLLLNGPFLGQLFETAVIMEHVKWASFSGNIPFMSYFRTKDGIEVDLFIEEADKLYAREIKINRTINLSFFENMFKAEKLLKRPMEKILLAPIEKVTAWKQDSSARPWQNVEW